MTGVEVISTVDGYRHACYRTDDGIHRVRVGCAHLSPSSAVKHATSLDPAPPSAPDPNRTGDQVPNGAAQAARALTEASDPAGSLPVPLRD